jgi:hypothetical protein
VGSYDRFLNLIEVPLTVEDTAFFRIQDNQEAVVAIVEGLIKQNGLLTLLWHHAVFNDREFPGWESAYRIILEYCKKKNAWITGAREISDWWRQRAGTKIDWEYKEDTLHIILYPADRSHAISIMLPRKMVVKRIANAEIKRAQGNRLLIQTEPLKGEILIELKPGG